MRPLRLPAAADVAPAVLLRTGARVARRAWREWRGLPPRADTADRAWLEGVLLPHHAARDEVRTVLLVGTRWYTRHYPSLLPRQRCLTIDIAPDAARHGSADGHLVADVGDVALHLPAGSVDLVLLNGVYGWGLDDAAAFERALRGLATVLRPGGELVFGWNDVARRRPFDWEAAAGWQAFAPRPFPPPDGPTRLALPTDNRHCFAFFVRREVVGEGAHAA